MVNSSSKKTVCLNMIVKNESSAIGECLDSVKKFIDYWIIVDTGSIDATEQVVKRHLAGIPGEFHHQAWVNFSENRNGAYLLAKNRADYTLFIDADETLRVADEFILPDLNKDIYSILVKQKGASSAEKWFLVRNDMPWSWVGVIHETISCSSPVTKEMMPGLYIFSDTERGARSQDPGKYIKDAQILLKALENDPTDARYRFFLAVCFLNANQPDKALDHFQKRCLIGGDPRELYISHLYIGKLAEHFGKSEQFIIDSYAKAYYLNPHRSEALFYLAAFYQTIHQYPSSYDILVKAPRTHQGIPFYQEDAVYDWKLDYFLARACLALRKYPEIRPALERVNRSSYLPEDVKEEVEKNLLILQQEVCS
ncbi:MAG: glycosyltransferase [Chlamydiae bacterium]|nr:glycosyltransferase [Chlamydiota bacterium]